MKFYIFSSWWAKVITGVFMLLCSFSVLLLAIEPSILLGERTFMKDLKKQGNLFTASLSSAGVLPNSPFYSLYESFHGSSMRNEEFLLLYAKIIKSSEIGNEDLSKVLFHTFLEKIYLKTPQEQEQVYALLKNQIGTLSIYSPTFEYDYYIFAKTNSLENFFQTLLQQGKKNADIKTTVQAYRVIFLDTNRQFLNNSNYSFYKKYKDQYLIWEAEYPNSNIWSNAGIKESILWKSLL